MSQNKTIYILHNSSHFLSLDCMSDLAYRVLTAQLIYEKMRMKQLWLELTELESNLNSKCTKSMTHQGEKRIISLNVLINHFMI